MELLIPQDEAAPDFSLPDLDDARHTLKDYLGRVVVLNFWSAECPWSRRADEIFTSQLAELAPEVKVLSIASNINEPREELFEEARQRGIEPLLIDQDHAIADLYRAQTTPHYFVIDRDGILRFQGAPDNATFRQKEATEDYLLSAVRAVMAGRKPDPDRSMPYGCTIVRHALN